MIVTRLSPDLSVAPQLHTSDLENVLAAGFGTIIDNRPDGEEAGQPTASELAEEARRLGLAFIHIPIIPGRMEDADARAFAEALAASDGPVLAFCRTGARSTDLWKRARELARLVD